MPASNYITTNQLPGRTLILAGQEYLFCSGTSYLGIAQNTQFREYVLEGMIRYGTNYSSSRNSNLQLQIFEETEGYLAAYTGAEAALTFSSGYLAGQAVMQTLASNSKIVYAPGTHPAVWGPVAEVSSTQEYERWIVNLLQQAPDFPEEQILIVSNSVDPLKAQKYSFDWVQELTQNKQITLLVDDSHGFGIIGPEGAGIFPELSGLSGVRVAVVSSLGKALGIPAGFILGDKEVVAQVRSSVYFGGASPAIPAYLYAFLQAENIFREARQTLFNNINTFKQQLSQPETFKYFNNYPVFYTPQEVLASYLLQNKVIISSFRYPTPTDAFITRIVLSSLHTSDDIQRLASLINQFQF